MVNTRCWAEYEKFGLILTEGKHSVICRDRFFTLLPDFLKTRTWRIDYMKRSSCTLKLHIKPYNKQYRYLRILISIYAYKIPTLLEVINIHVTVTNKYSFHINVKSIQNDYHY